MNIPAGARKTLILFLALAFAAGGRAQDFVQGGAKTGLYSGYITTNKMSARLTYDAIQFRGHAVPRVAEVDYVFADDADEHERLNTYGVMIISGQCQKAEELPFKSVYLEFKGKKYPLTCLLSRKVEPGSEVAAKILGKYRMDCYYLLPYGYTRLDARLCLDWGAKRNGFKLNKFPAKFTLYFVKDGFGFKPEKNRRIDHDALKDFLKREFSFSNDDANEAKNNLVKSGL
jgi:hypothetical protein